MADSDRERTRVYKVVVKLLLTFMGPRSIDVLEWVCTAEVIRLRSDGYLGVWWVFFAAIERSYVKVSVPVGHGRVSPPWNSIAGCGR